MHCYILGMEIPFVMFPDPSICHSSIGSHNDQGIDPFWNDTGPACTSCNSGFCFSYYSQFHFWGSIKAWHCEAKSWPSPPQIQNW